MLGHSNAGHANNDENAVLPHQLPPRRRSGPDGCPLAWQPVPVEPITHRGCMHAKLAGDPAARPPPRARPVGQIGPQRREAELGRPGGQLLVGAAAALAGRAHPSGWWGQAGVVEQAAGTTVVVPSSLASWARLECCWQRTVR